MDASSGSPGYSIAIVGAGPVAVAFACAVHAHARHRLRVVTSRDPSSAKRLCSLIKSRHGQCHAIAVPLGGLGLDNSEQDIAKATFACSSVQLVIVAVSDSALADPASSVAARVSALFPNATHVCHTSGALPSSVLRGAGAHVFALHPATPFPQTGPPTDLRGVLCAVSSSTREIILAGEALAESLGMRAFCIANEENKPLYHAACCMAANFSALSVSAALTALNSCTEGLSAELGAQLVADLSRKAVSAVQSAAANNVDPASAITGPVARGDVTTVVKHLTAFPETPEFVYELYAHATQVMVSSLEEAGRIDSVVSRRMRDALKEDLEKR